MFNKVKLKLRNLNPITKGFLCVIYILIFSFFCKSWQIGLVMNLFVLLSCLFIDEDVIQLIISLKKILLLLIIVAIFQGFSGNEFNYVNALSTIFRIIGVFFVATLYTKVSTQNELLYFWEKCFKPLKLFGVSSSEYALTMVIAIRFLPVFMDEIERIKIAQIARGAKLKTNSIVSAINFMPLLIPILTQAIMRSEELADAMEVRGYSTERPRSLYKKYSFGKYDFLTIFFTTIIIVVLAYIK